MSALIRHRVLQPSILRLTPYIPRSPLHQQTHHPPTEPGISMSAFFPDDYESSPLSGNVSSKQDAAKWDEHMATISEASVRADREGSSFKPGMKNQKDKDPSTMEREPEIDEM